MPSKTIITLKARRAKLPATTALRADVASLATRFLEITSGPRKYAPPTVNNIIAKSAKPNFSFKRLKFPNVASPVEVSFATLCAVWSAVFSVPENPPNK